MPRRDGSPTQQELAQRYGDVPPPPPPPSVPPGVGVAAAVAAGAGAATPVAVSLAAAGILGAFDRFLSRRQQEEADDATAILEEHAPELGAEEISGIVDQEVGLERAYQAKARARLDRDLPRALALTDAAERTLRVQGILDRERRFLEMREAAVTRRALGASEQRTVERLSPMGGFWDLSPYVSQHTPDCLAMGGKVWPHTILRNFHPPLHGGCECQIKTVAEAIAEGKLPHDFSPTDARAGDQAVPVLALAESLWVDPELAELELLEGAYELRYPSGTQHGGEFRPRRGGNPGAALRMKHRLPRMNLGAEFRPVAPMGQENDVRHIPVGDLKAGDHVHVNGALERVTAVKSPGLFELERSGLVHTDRPTVRGVPSGEGSATLGSATRPGGAVSAELTNALRQLHEEPHTDRVWGTPAQKHATGVLQALEPGGAAAEHAGVSVRRAPGGAYVIKTRQGDVQAQVRPDDAAGHLQMALQDTRPASSTFDETVPADVRRRYEDAKAHAAMMTAHRLTLTNLTSEHVSRSSLRYDWRASLHELGLSESDLNRPRVEAAQKAERDAHDAKRAVQREIYGHLLHHGRAFEVVDHSDRLSSKPFEVRARSETVGVLGGDAFLRETGANLRLSRFKTHENAQAAADSLHKREIERIGARDPRANDEQARRFGTAPPRPRSPHTDAVKAALEAHGHTVTEEGSVGLGHATRLKVEPEYRGRYTHIDVHHDGHTTAYDPTAKGHDAVTIKPPEPTPEGPDYGGHHGLPVLPRFEEGNRFEMRFAPNAELDIHDREKGKTHARFGEWSVEHVHRITDELNADDRAAKAAKATAPAPAVPERLSHADVLSIASMRKPDAGGELKPGVHFNPDITRSEARGADLHVPEGYFKQSKALRQNVIFRHFGRQIAEQHGQRLGEQDAHLRSTKGIVDTYTALNGPSREEYVALHPDAARLVAGSARELGLPLHPEAAKLAGAPAASDAAPSEHPAHALAKLLRGEDYRAATDRLREAGYLFESDDARHKSFVNLDHGARITVDTQTGIGGTKVVDSTVEKFPAPTEGLSDLVGMSGADAERALGPHESVTSLHPWMVYVGANGEGRALKISDGGKVTAAITYPPTPVQVREARAIAIRKDPVGLTRPGDDFETVRAALDYGHAYSPSQSREVPSSGVIAPVGATHYTDFHPMRSDAFAFENVRVYTREKPGGGYEVVAIGHQHPSSPQMLTPEQFSRELADAQEKRRAYFEERQREEQAKAAGSNRAIELIRAGDAKAAERELVGRQKAGDLVAAMRKAGFELNANPRRSGRGEDRTYSYRLRGPDGSSVRIVGGATYSDPTVRKIEIKANPQGGERRRVSRLWRDRKELYVDALGRADELAQRHGGVAHVTAIIDSEGATRGAAAHHEWNGSIVMGKGSGFSKRFDTYIKRANAGESMTDAEHLDFYDAMTTLQHEINHGVASAGSEQGGVSFGSRHYSGAGKAMEEALTEESARALTIDWLRANGLTDVLRAVKRNPGHRALSGSYPEYRVRLKAALDRAGVPPEERTALVYRMKFEMSPEERLAELGRLLGDEKAGSRAMSQSVRYSYGDRSAYQVLPDDPIADVQAGTKSAADLGAGDRAVFNTRQGPREGVVQRAMGGSFYVRFDDGQEPPWATMSTDDVASVVHVPELGKPPQARGAGGRTLEINSPVEVDTADGRIPGRVIEIDPVHPSEIKVERADGLTLWTTTSRLH